MELANNISFFKPRISVRRHPKTINSLGKKLSVYTRGNGSIPLLVVGQASLFKKPKLIPDLFDNVFTTYFVDLFEQQQNINIDITNLRLKDIVNAIESIRTQLKLEKIAILGHSATGIISIEYANSYSNNVLFTIMIGTSPIWGDKKKIEEDTFFLNNASQERIETFNLDQSHLKKLLEPRNNKISDTDRFILNYSARRAYLHFDPTNSLWDSLWDGVKPDVNLISAYFKLLEGYDIAKNNSIEVPIFLALGMFDYTCPFYTWIERLESLANITIHIFEKSGHYPQVEESELFFSKLNNFILDKLNLKLISNSSILMAV